MNDIRVYGVALLGLALPGVEVDLGDIMDALVHLGQFGVAVATILYILAKRKNLRDGRSDDDSKE
jgi:hypothetical protein